MSTPRHKTGEMRFIPDETFDGPRSCWRCSDHHPITNPDDAGFDRLARGKGCGACSWTGVDLETFTRQKVENAVLDAQRAADEALAAVRRELDLVRGLRDTPQTADFLQAVAFEADHQVARWGSKHDAGKTHEDWFWLLGWLIGKAVHAANSNNKDKALHHTISSAAALLNWHRAISGAPTTMRPGILPPDSEP